MDQFIAEIEVELLRAEDPAVMEFLKGALRLARECQEKEEMQLRLDGD
ncbi:hypothetical protein [Streptomyces sp. 35G-GA-8]|nr:hypothetical protein [Streptomyces sp. 35G-GA-8]MCL7377078.1 hypothetical protein [Streptomyces sp. 35G-GA-8]